MKNNFSSSKKPKIGFIALLLFFCGLWGNTAMAQTAYTWVGGTSTNWNTDTNWSPVGVPGGNTGDTVIINDNSTAFAPSFSGTAQIAGLNISNAFGTESGATLTIASGALSVITSNTTVVVLAGGSIINNGTLNITSTAITASFGLQCTTPTVPPTAAREYGYSGDGFLNINISATTGTNASAVNINSLNANTTYKMLFNSANTTFTLSSTATATCFAFRSVGGANMSPIIIGGTGFTIGGVNGGLISLGGRSNVTVNAGTTLTMNSAATNITAGISGFHSGTAVTPLSFMNKGTINILGTSARSGISMTVDNIGNSNYSPTSATINFENQGAMNVDMTIPTASQAPLLVGVSGTGQGNVNVKNTSTGIMTLKNNNANGTNIGSAIFVTNGGNVTNVNFTNNGSLALRGNNVVNGNNGGTVAIPRSSLINTGTITSNNNLAAWVVSNSATGTISFVSTAGTGATATPFTGPIFTNNGKIQTATGSTLHTNLNRILSYSATSTIEPGGAGYGVADLGVIGTTAPSGTLKLQISGNTAAGVDYDQLNITTGGVGYTALPTITFAGGVGSGATGYVNVTSGVITSVTMVSGGSGYTNGSAVTFSVGVGQTGTAVVSGGAITGVTLSGTKTTNYTANSNITFASAVTTAATATATLSGGTTGFVTGVTLDTGGAGYTSVPTVSFSASGSTTSAAVTATVSGGVVTGFNTVLSLSNLNLDIPFLYTPAGPVTIPIVNLSGLGATISGTFATVTGLKAGWALDYSSPTVVNLVYTSGTTTPNAWTGTNSSVWTDSGNWSAGVPTVSSDVTIPTASSNQPVIGSNVDINSLVIESGKSLTVNTGFNLSVTDGIANNGSLTIASNANLIQVNDVANSGTITVNRESNALSRLDFTSWSSPVTNASQFLTTFSPATSLNRFYNYNETTNEYNEITTPAATQFAAGTGYLIRMPNTHPTSPTIWNGSFSGVPNNGTINKAIAYSGATFGYNMIGNPYPSTIDAQAFITANTATIESSLYFWRKINAATGSAYAVYNPLGATTATPSSALPNGTIQVGQGFFVKAKSASSVNFTNAMRVANNSNQFFKTKATQKDRVWLNLTTTSGVFSQALIGYRADATSGVDMYDAKYINDSPIALTSSINGDEYTIQGRPAFDATDVVALNFKTDAAGDYTIAIDQADGVFAAGQDVYLVDSKTGTETNLNNGSYTFAATAGVDNSRFSLKYQKTLSIDTQSFDDNSISVYANNGTLYVNSKSAAISNVTVYDVQGRLIAQKVNVKSTTAVINNLRASNQVLIVKIEGEDSSVVTKKLLN